MNIFNHPKETYEIGMENTQTIILPLSVQAEAAEDDEKTMELWTAPFIHPQPKCRCRKTRLLLSE